MPEFCIIWKVRESEMRWPEVIIRNVHSRDKTGGAMRSVRDEQRAGRWLMAL